MTLNPRQDEEIARFNEMYADLYHAWLVSQPVVPEEPRAANDNQEL